MNTHLKQLWAAMKLPEKLQKSYKFFCRGLDIRVAEIMKSYPLYTRPLNSGMYHNADRRRTIGKITAAMPGMDGDMWTLAQQTLSKLKRMTDSDYDSQKFYFTDENE